MKEVLVFGGSGFVGSYVADILAAKGYRTHIFDKQRSEYLSQNQSMILGDITDPSAVEEAVKGKDIVFNFAALADLNQALSKPRETVEINVLGNVNVLDACVRQKVNRLMYASTVYVSGTEGGFYRCSKQAAESYIKEYQKRYGLNYTILRFGSLYGARADGSNGVRKIIENALATGKVSYSGDPDAIREYIHVEDAARSCLVLTAEEYINQTVVLTGREAVRVSDLLFTIGEILGLPKSAVSFSSERYEGHYVRTPYAYQPHFAMKYSPETYIDLGQGLVELVKTMDLNTGKYDEVVCT